MRNIAVSNDKESDFLARLLTCGTTLASSKALSSEPVPSPVPYRFFSTICGCTRMAEYLPPSCPGGERAGAAN